MARNSPVLPIDAASCRGSSQSGVCPERSGGTRRPQAVAPLTASFRGDRIAQRGRTARPLRQARLTGVRDGGDRLVAGAGERRCGGGPRRASLRKGSGPGPPPPAARLPASLAAYGGNPRPSNASPKVNPALMLRVRPGPDDLAHRRCALEDVEKVVTGQGRPACPAPLDVRHGGST